jgi:hypothetical protein
VLILLNLQLGSAGNTGINMTMNVFTLEYIILSIALLVVVVGMLKKPKADDVPLKSPENRRKSRQTAP